jgi:hypothetical protein
MSPKETTQKKDNAMNSVVDFGDVSSVSKGAK